MGKSPYDELKEKIHVNETRFFWLGSGGSYSLNLPKAWAENFKEEEKKGRVNIYSYGNNLIIAPYEKTTPDRLVMKITDEDPSKFILKLESAYILGHDEIVLHCDSHFDNALKIAKGLQQKLEGIDYDIMSDGILISVSTKERKLKELLDSEFQSAKKLYSIDFDLYSSKLQDSSTIKQQVEAIGDQQDKVSFLLKRLLHKTYQDPELLSSSGIKEIEHIPCYYDVGDRLERIGDLYEEIYSEFVEEKHSEVVKTEHKVDYAGLMKSSMDYLDRSYDCKSFDEAIELRLQKDEKTSSPAKIVKKLEEYALKNNLGGFYSNIRRRNAVIGLSSNVLELWARLYFHDDVIETHLNPIVAKKVS